MRQNTASSTVKKLLKLSFVVMILIIAGGTTHASELKQEVQLASRLEKDASKIGKSTEVIDPWLMNVEKPTFLDEALWNVEGLHAKRLSGAEGTLSIYSRGMRSTDSVLEFNGFKFRDPSDTQGSSAPILQDVLLTPYDNIEIVKGSSSSVSGSTPQGALIDLSRPYTKRLSFTEEVGSMRRFKESLTVSDMNYRLDTIRMDTDRYSNSTFSGSVKLGNERVSIEPSFYHIDSVATLHDPTFILGGVVFRDASNYLDKRENDLGLYGLKSELYLNDAITLYNLVSLTQTDRRFVFGSFDSDGTFEGQDFAVDTYLTLKHSEMFSSSIGYKFESEDMTISQVGVVDEREASQNSGDVYAEEKIQINDLSLLLQGRYNNQHGSKSAWTYDVSGTYPITSSWKVGSHFGTGFRNASLYERYGAFLTSFGIFDIGNPRLSPEKSYTWDSTVSYSDNLNTLGVTPFISHVGNPIVLESAIYTNSRDSRDAHGIEAFYERHVGHFSYRANYTYTTGENLLDIPMHEVGNSLIYQKDDFTGNLRLAYQSEKDFATFSLDTFTVQKVSEPAGFVAGATASYHLNDNVEIYTKIDNLFNRNYTDGGYTRHGLEAYVGITISV